jgi:flagellar FliL protein
MSADAAEDGDAAGLDEGGDSPRKKLSGKKIVLFIMLPLLLLIGAGAGLIFSGVLDSLLGRNKPPAEAAPDAQPQQKAQPATKQSIFLDLPDQIVNLNTKGARKATFLKISVSLELESPGDIELVNTAMPRIIDNFQIYLRELRIEDLQGSAGMYRLREELLRRVNLAARPARVKDVLFKEMLVQ